MRKVKANILVLAVGAAVAASGFACSRGEPAARAPSLEGTYRAYSGPNTLQFKGSEWTLTTGPRVFSGKFVVAGDRLVLLLTFANHPAYENFCRTDMDVYSWSLADRSLILRTVGTTAPGRATDRVCDTVADQVFRNGPWTKTA